MYRQASVAFRPRHGSYNLMLDVTELMTAPVALVPKPKAADEIRESVMRLLRDSLEQAERGEVDTVIIIVGHPDGDWTNKSSYTDKLSAAIGRLEITKQEWIEKYLRNRDG